MMADFDSREIAAYKKLCSHAFGYAKIIEETIFAKITEETTPAEFDTALYLLLTLCQRCEAQVDMLHYPAAVGTHQCVRDVYLDAHARLLSISLLRPAPQQPAPAPEPPTPTPPPASPSLESVVEQFEEETFLGDSGT